MTREYPPEVQTAWLIYKRDIHIARAGETAAAANRLIYVLNKWDPNVDISQMAKDLKGLSDLATLGEP